MAEKTKFEVRQEECRKCRWYDIMTNVESRQQTGICRRHPPKVFAQALPVQTQNGMGVNWTYSSMWTMVRESDFCGEFNAKATQ